MRGRVFRRWEPVFGTGLVVQVGGDHRQLSRIMAKHWREKYETVLKSCDPFKPKGARTLWQTGSVWTGVAFCERAVKHGGPDLAGLIAHEAFHIARRQMVDVGMDMNCDNDEGAAYYIQFVATTIHRALRKSK